AGRGERAAFFSPLGPASLRSRGLAQAITIRLLPVSSSAPSTTTWIKSPATSRAASASRRGRSGCPQESPNPPQVPPRIRRTPLLTIPPEQGGSAWRPAGVGRSSGPTLPSGGGPSAPEGRA